jgi:hypothetical protein
MIDPKSDNGPTTLLVVECSDRADTAFSIDYSADGNTGCPRWAAARD